MDDRELLKAAFAHLTIQDVYLRECSIRQKEGYDPKIPKYEKGELLFLHRPMPAFLVELEMQGNPEKIHLLKAGFETIFRLLPPRDSDEMAGVDLTSAEATIEKAQVDVRALFTAEYVITDGPLEQEAVDAFCKLNVGYHVWPYWRELAQSIGNRLRLPPIIPPLYVLPTEAQPEKKPAERK